MVLIICTQNGNIFVLHDQAKKKKSWGKTRTEKKIVQIIIARNHHRIVMLFK